MNITNHSASTNPLPSGTSPVLNAKFVFMATKGRPREDKLSNRHRMYEVTGVGPSYFKQINGPWRIYSNATCAYKYDINRDGLDDIILCNQMDYPRVYIQPKVGAWREVFWNTKRRQVNWRKVRMGDFDGDGIPDLLVAYFNHQVTLRIFKGIRRAPYIDFGTAYWDTKLDFAAPDLEVMDFNGDGKLDFYVVHFLRNFSISICLSKSRFPTPSKYSPSVNISPQKLS